MRWFDDAAFDAEDSDWHQIAADYHAHVKRIAPSLPPHLARLALEPELNLHDARFQHVEVDRDRRTVTIVVNAGDLQVGYRRLTLWFTDASVVPDNLQRLGYIVGAEFRSRHGRGVTEIRAQEVDLLADGRYALRLHLWPFYEFAVEFHGFTLTEEAIADRGRARGASFQVHSKNRD